MEDKKAFEYLLQQYLLGELTDAERIRLLNALNDKENIQKLREWIEVYFDRNREENNIYDRERVNKMIGDILEKDSFSVTAHRSEKKTEPDLPGVSIMEDLSAGSGDQTGNNNRKRLRTVSLWIRYAAAAVVLGIGLFFYVQYRKNIINTSESAPSLVQTTDETDVLPGSNKAILTLSDGQQVELNESGSQVIKDGKLDIRNRDGSLVYNKSDLVVYNTMSTPRGGQFKLVLPDGTKVWLNAASSITYPTSFPGETREVSITGEAYFEVTKNPSKPFTVRTYKDEITVKGTSFNVNSYPDEPAVKTSLLEGLVEIDGKVLLPGNAFMNGRISETDLNKDLAWKNGAFNFHQMKLSEAMRQISRWYDIEIQYNGKMEDIELRGEIGRTLTLQQVLDGLQDKDLHFKLAGRILTVY